MLMEQKADFTTLQNYRFFSNWVERLSNGYKSMLDFQDKFRAHGLEPYSVEDLFIQKHASAVTSEVYELMTHLKVQVNLFYELLDDFEIDDLNKNCYD